MAAEKLKIRNWRNFQHYQRRSPSWVKLHYDLLQSEDWVTLDHESRALMVACMLIGSRHDGFVPNNPDYIRRVTFWHITPNLKPLIECGFLQYVQADASTLQAHASNMLDQRREETEKSREETDIDSPSENLSSPNQEKAGDEKKGKEAIRPKSIDVEVRGEFDRVFWPRYPHKVAKAKALVAFIKARKKADLSDIMRGLASYIRHKPLDRSWLNPTTFLNGERWNDNYSGQQAVADAPKRKSTHDSMVESLLEETEEFARMGGRQANPNGRDDDHGGSAEGDQTIDLDTENFHRLDHGTGEERSNR